MNLTPARIAFVGDDPSPDPHAEVTRKHRLAVCAIMGFDASQLDDRGEREFVEFLDAADPCWEPFNHAENLSQLLADTEARARREGRAEAAREMAARHREAHAEAEQRAHR